MTLLVATDGQAVLRSHDDGATWRRLKVDQDLEFDDCVRCLLPDPRNPHAVFTGATELMHLGYWYQCGRPGHRSCRHKYGDLFRSADGGSVGARIGASSAKSPTLRGSPRHRRPMRERAMNIPRIQRVAHIVLYVLDPQASAQWYRDVLGMQLSAQVSNGPFQGGRFPNIWGPRS
jgi:Glyoxalase/Bleomycin resistance protein/Dioxygenase superfamily